ncbi:MAG: SAM-dependent methyltransferase [Chitinophagaceae bacterium]|nr:SAM-dependent methyltransferase [Chitinophagaceae bacterium]MDB5223596.1 SAM-dependent methyltransferase [Chitinophagaceae bacterium]
MAERSFDDFDAYAKDYRNIHTENIRMSGADSFYFAEMKVKLLQEFENNVALKILDIGCGDGATEVYMNKYFPLWQISAIDISEKSIEEAQNKDVFNCDFKLYDGKDIPFPDESFDIIFMAGVLHHINLSLHNNLIREVNRVIKKAGRFYLFEHNPLNPVTKHLVNTCVFDKDAKLLQSGNTRRLLAENDFKIKHKRFIIFFPRKGVLSKLIFLEKYLQWLPLGGQYFIIAKKD